MAQYKGSFTWPNHTSTNANYVTQLQAFITAICALSDEWSITKEATIYSTNYIFGAIYHSTGHQVVFATGTGDDPIHVSNLGESADIDDILYISYSTSRGSSHDCENGNPLTEDWCVDAGASLFYAMHISGDEINGGIREANFIVDDDAGYLILEWEDIVDTPYGMTLCSGAGASSLFRTGTFATGLGEAIFIWRNDIVYASALAGGQIGTAIAGVWTEDFDIERDAVMVQVDFNPSEPWYMQELKIWQKFVGSMGALDVSFISWVRSGAIANLTAMDGDRTHVTDGMICPRLV